MRVNTTTSADSDAGGAKPLRVVCVTTHGPGSTGWGGAVVSGVEMARLIASVYPAVLICSDANRNGPPLKSKENPQEAEYRLRTYSSKYLKKWGFGFGALYLLALEISRASVVYISGVSTWPVTAAALFARMMKKKYIVAPQGGLLLEHIQEIRRSRPLKKIVYEAVVIPIAAAASVVRVASDFEARQAQELLAKTRIQVVPNTFPISSIPYHPSSRQGNGLKLVFVGRLEPDKGIKSFTEIWSGCSLDSDELAIAGQGSGPYADALRAFTHSDPRITLFGELGRAQVFSAIAAADALVLPSGLDGALRENFGNVVVEALACGRPVLVSQGLAWDEVGTAKVGWTMPLRPDQLRQELPRILAELRAVDGEVSQRCRHYVQSRFDSDAVRTAVKKMIADVANTTGESSAGGAANVFTR